MSSSLGTMAPPGGEAPGGEAPPGGRQAPGGRPPRLSVGHAGKSARMRVPRGILGAPRPGAKQTVKTTVKPSVDPLGRAREYMRSRPDIMPKKAAEGKAEKKAPEPAQPVTQSGNMPTPKNMGAGGAEERKAKARANYAARKASGAPRKATRKAVKDQNLGSPGKEADKPLSMEDILAKAPPRTPEEEEHAKGIVESRQRQAEQGERLQAIKDRVEQRQIAAEAALRKQEALPEPKIVDADPGSGVQP